MSDHYLDNLLPDFGEYSLESFLDNYRKRPGDPADKPAQPPTPAAQAKTAEAIAQRSRQIVMEALGETLNQHKSQPHPVAETDFDLYDLTSLLDDEPKADAPAQAGNAFTFDKEETPAPKEDEAPILEEEDAPTPEEEPAPEEPKHQRIHISPEGIITLDIELAQSPEGKPVSPVKPAEPEDIDGEEDDFDESEDDDVKEYRPGQHSVSRPRPAPRPRQEERPGIAERFLRPLVRFAATRIALRQMQKAEAANWPDPVDIRETDELSPKKAMSFYGQQIKPLRFRFRICVFLCIVLAWISLKLPMAGLLGKSLAVQSGVSLVLLMTVMIATLDILAAGVRQLFDLRPGGEALATLAALMSCVDAAMVMSGYGSYVPFCAVGAFSLTAALWGEKLDCTARARTMRAAAMSKSPAALTAQETARGGRYLCRSGKNMDGIVRRSEQPDFCQIAYATAAPLFLLASVLLAAVSSMDGQGAYFLHTLSALLSVSASFTAFLSFPLAYAMIARRLQFSGAAIIGYAGCADMGKTKRVVISDGDLFPPGTMKLSGINILEGAEVEKVICFTAGLLAASGSGVSGVFTELVTRRNYNLPQVEEFRCHEGGGLSARVNGEQVLVGSAGFMNLMGIRLPQNMTVKNAVCTAINGELLAIFTMEYIPVSSVQEALMTLLQGRTQPIFAIRDFNITPLMIRQLFRMPTDNFNFPTFRDRYRIASAAADKKTPISAVLSRTGMGPLVDAAEAGRKLYSVCRAGTFISIIATVVGLVIMFLLCRAGSFDTATAGNVLSYLILWSLPVVFLAYGQSR